MPGGVEPACIVVEGERIVEIAPYSSLPSEAHVKDFGTQFVLPGLVDSHIHINEPGRTEWEGFETATRAAAAGGYTCLVDMPLNSIPATTSLEALLEKRAAASGKALIDYAFWGGAVTGNVSHLGPLAKAGVAGFKAFLVPSGVDEFSMLDEAGLRQAMPVIAATGLPLLVHAELPGPIAKAQDALPKASKLYSDYLKSRPDEAELQAIRLMSELARQSRCRVHIVHLATADAIAELRQARAERLPITVETCPHYLYFDGETIPDGATQFKCAPPIRGARHREGLWQALRDADIDLIATDHSPCPVEMKRPDTGDFFAAWGGISSVSLALSVVWTKARERDVSISDVVRWMSAKPAELAALPKGRLVVGAEADVTVFDPEREWRVTEDDLHFRNKVSPYLGQRLTGRVMATFLRGTAVFEDGKFFGLPRGRECKVEKL